MQRILRMDKSPYVKNTFIGLAQVFFGILVAIGIAVTFFLLSVIKISQRHIDYFPVNILFYSVALIPSLIFLIPALSGIRGMFYYFRMPKDWRK